MLQLQLRSLLLLFAIALLSAPVSAQDMSKYYTVMHPEEFTIDWTGFYKANSKATLRVRNSYPHHLDLAFGSDPKQALDLYLPLGEVSNAPFFCFYTVVDFAKVTEHIMVLLLSLFLKKGSLLLLPAIV